MIGFFLNKIWPYGLLLRIKYIYYHLRSAVVKQRFKSAGSKFYFEPVLSLIGPEAIIIGNSFSGGKGMRLEAFKSYNGQDFDPSIIIGNYVNIGYNCHIGCINKIQIGNNVLIASNVYISDHSHGDPVLKDFSLPPAKRPLYSKGGIDIGNNVWIGENVIILPGVSIGDNAIIGANSVVTKSFSNDNIIAGNPAKIIR